MIGERVADWVIDADAGADHKGRAYRGHFAADPARKVIVKVLATAGQVPDFHDLFRGRVTAIRKLAHPNLVPWLGGGIVHALPYVVSEDVGGTDFQTLLRDGKRPAWTDVLGYALQIVAALRHAHHRGVLHGDLKPANLILAADGQVRVAECGLSRLFEASVPFAGDNPLASAAFVSPEQAAGKPSTKRGDFYSLGCLLYALVTGRPPFTAANAVELIHKHCFVMPERPIHFVPDLPEEVDALILRLMSKEPSGRPGSGTLLLAELDRLWAAFEARGRLPKRPPVPADEMPLPVEVDEPVAPLVTVPPAPPRPLMRRPWVVVPMFLGVVALTALGFYLSRTDPDELYARAQPLMRSDDPADWDRAWAEYLQPLSRDHPDRYADEVKAFRARTEPLGELRKAIATGKRAGYQSEAERWYHAGLELCRAGDFAGAKRLWDRVVVVYGGVDDKWVEFSRQAAARVPPGDGALRRPAAATEVRAALDRARALKATGKSAEADGLLDALEALYRDDPDAAEVRELIRKGRSP
jgi:hypothetical protein